MKAATSRRLKCDAARVEADLRRLLQGEPDVPDRLRRAMAHSLFGGGKRLRPILLAWTHAALRGKGGPPPRSVREAGAALEMLHTYSLIHDDLPAMDDDDLRRGHPTCHVAFDEATAILAGDALQCLAFGILARIPRHGAALAERLAGAAGPAGMVGGQQEDLDSEGGPHSAALIARIHDLKTARLIACALSMGAILAGVRPARVERIEAAGRRLGAAFQAADDLLDVEGSAEQLGKTPGKDLDAGKATWIALEGIEAARRRTQELGERGVDELAGILPAGAARDRLLDLVGYLWTRRH